MKNLKPEIIEKARTVKSVEELLLLAKENGIEITPDEATTYFAQLNAECCELCDNDIDSVTGGFLCENKEDARQRENESKVIHTIVCPKCGAIGNWSVYHSCKGGYVWICNVCSVRGVLEESDGYSVMHTSF